MANYGQFCPVAKASELLGERWTLLILRELVLGTDRFSDFQRALSRISPSLLTKRLNQLENSGLILKKQQKGRKGYQYYLTAAGKELAPVIEHLATWGMRWVRSQLNDDELDVEFLMWELQRRINLSALPDGETVICFNFGDLERLSRWWIVIDKTNIDLCTESHGKEVDIYINTSVRTMVEIWQGDVDIKIAMKNNRLQTQGNRLLIKTLPDWLGICLYAHIQPDSSLQSRR